MTRAFHFRMVEVRPTRDSAMYRDDPSIKGAFVDAVVAARNPDQALKRFKSALVEDGYQLIGVDEVLDFSESTWGDQEVEREYNAMARDALATGEVQYGEFHCYLDVSG